MSWSLSAVGKPAAVLAKLKADASRNSCPEPEQTIRAQAMVSMETLLNSLPPGSAVQVNASGSQWVPDSTKPTEAVNTLTFEVKPLFGFVE